MMDIQTIRSENAKAGRKAKAGATLPRTFTADEISRLRAGDLDPLKRIPRTGNWHPRGFKVITDHFVDASGFGRPSEPAMTAKQFADYVVANDGKSAFGISEVGQFQIYITEFRDTRRAPGRVTRGARAFGAAMAALKSEQVQR